MTTTRPTPQTRKVQHAGHGYHMLHMLYPGTWALHTAVGMLVFVKFRNHWMPYFRDGQAGADVELYQWSTTQLNTCVRRVMSRARCAHTLAAGLRTLGSAS